jgi:hypothetical protein
VDEKKIKESIDTYIGKEKLFTNQFRNRVLSNALKSKPQGVPLIYKLKPIFALLFLIVGGLTYFFLSDNLNENLTTADKGNNELVEKPIVEEPEKEPVSVDTSNEIVFDLKSHGKEFPELENDLRKLFSTVDPENFIVEEMIDSVNGVSINKNGTLVVEFKNFKNAVPTPHSHNGGKFGNKLYDTIFKYPEVKEVYFTFNGSFTAWYQWLEGSPIPMVRQYVLELKEFDYKTHGKPFPELENDLNNLMLHGYAIDELNSRNVEVLANSVNGVSINEFGTVVVEFKDFRNEFGSLTTNEMGVFLWPLHDTVFKYPEVKEVYFTFEGNFTDWYQWLQSGPEPMIRQTEQAQTDIDNLLSSHPYYKNMYQLILEAKMPDNHAAEVFILYLEALKNNDGNEVKKYSVSNDHEIVELLNEYRQIDYNSLSIDKIIPSQGEPVYEVHLNFKQKDGSSRTRKVFIQFYESQISIFD